LEVWKYNYNTILRPNINAGENQLRDSVEGAMAAHAAALEMTHEDWNAEQAAKIRFMMESWVHKQDLSMHELIKRLSKRKDETKEQLKSKLSLKRTLLYKIKRGDIYAIYFIFEQSFSDGRRGKSPLIYFYKKKNGIWNNLADNDDERIIQFRSDILHLMTIENPPFLNSVYNVFSIQKMRTPKLRQRKLRLNY
jgi:hypothetical protein